jgi:hypothetical protein
MVMESVMEHGKNEPVLIAGEGEDFAVLKRGASNGRIDRDSSYGTVSHVWLEPRLGYRRTGKIAQYGQFLGPYEPGRLHPPEIGRVRLSDA